MEHIKNLRSVYSFPGCDARATVQSYDGDPAALVVTLRRRGKKRSAARVAPRIDPITTRARIMCATSLAGIGGCSCCSRGGA
jgi:hypothetical protein